MNLDRVISYLTGAERLAANIQIARNLGDGTQFPTGKPASGPGMVSPSADIVPAGTAEADVIAQADTEAAFNAQTLPPASRTLLGLRPPLTDARTATAQNARPGQSQATSNASSSSAAAAATVADGGTSSAAEGERSTMLGSARPVSGASTTDGTDLPMSDQPRLGIGDGEGNGSAEFSGALSPGMSDESSLTGSFEGALANAADAMSSETTPSVSPGSTGVAADPASQSVQSETATGESPSATTQPTDTAAPATSGAGEPTSQTTTAATTSTASAQPGLDAAVRDPLALAGALLGGAAGNAQTERAGIIASFVLNAAMIPGWPPPRPFEAARPDAALAVRQLQAGMDEAEATGYLAKLGVPAGMLARLAAWVEAFKRRARIWFGVMVLIGSSLAVLHSLKDEEDEPDEDELMAPDGRARLFLR